jgi:hypothetical protein
MKVVRLSALHTGRLYPQEGLSLKNSSDSIGNRTRDLSACSAVPQPTAPPRTSPSEVYIVQHHVTHTSHCRLLLSRASVTGIFVGNEIKNVGQPLNVVGRHIILANIWSPYMCSLSTFESWPIFRKNMETLRNVEDEFVVFDTEMKWIEMENSSRPINGNRSGVKLIQISNFHRGKTSCL